MKVIVTGGCGYIGSMLVPHLLAQGHEAKVISTQYFGSGHLPNNPNLVYVNMDVRDIAGLEREMAGYDACIHLASLVNNEMCVRAPDLSEEINVDAAVNVAVQAQNYGMRFIYASSVAVYGTADRPMTESDELKPTTLYGEQKVKVENWLREHFPKAIITRAATLSGYSTNMMFHTTVHRMVNEGYRLRKITVNGGSQIRAHVHLRDLIDAYLSLLSLPGEKVEGNAFNIVAQNMSVLESAKTVQAIMEYKPVLFIGPATDDRSYIVDGSKALRMLGLAPKLRINDAVWELKTRFEGNYWPDSIRDERYLRLTSNYP